MKVVLDASAAVELVLKRSKGPQLARSLESAEAVLTPDLYVSEVVNTIWKYHQFEKLSLDVCDQALNLAVELVDTFVPARDVFREAFLLARTSRRPAYDMFYLAVARREDGVLVTLDTALRKEAERQGIRVV